MREYDMADMPDYEAQARELRLTLSKMHKENAELRKDNKYLHQELENSLRREQKLNIQLHELRKAGEELAEKANNVLNEAKHYDNSWSVPQFLADEPTVAKLHIGLARWQELNPQ